MPIVRLKGLTLVLQGDGDVGGFARVPAAAIPGGIVRRLPAALHTLYDVSDAVG